MINGTSEIANVLSNVFKQFNITDDIELRYSNLENVDIQCNNLLRLAKSDITDEFKSTILKSINSLELVKKVEILENNFLNINFSNKYFEKFALIDKHLLKTDSRKSILFDYGGPNIGKDLHVGHIRTLNIGRSLYNINKLAGNKVISDIHFGDWGMPVALIVAYAETNMINIENLKFSDFETIYPKATMLSKENEDFYKKAKMISKKLNDGDKFYINKWKLVYEIVIPEIKSLVKKLGHDFDLWLGESNVIENIKEVLIKAKTENKIKLDDDAYISTEALEPPVLITKSDGSFLYLTTDLGTVDYRERNFNIDTYMYVVDQRQQNHFEQLFSTIKHFEMSTKEFLHIGFGTINNIDGKPFKTRDGEIYKLRTLFEDIMNKLIEQNKNNQSHNLVNTVLTYSDLLPNRTQNYIFDVDKFTDINGKTGVYLQYSQVRAKKLLDESSYKSITGKFENINDDEKSLLFLISKFYYYFNLSLHNNEPHHLAEYTFNLAQSFNSFYSNNKIFSDAVDENVKITRLEIVKRFYDAIIISFECLGIKPEEEM